MPKKEQKQHSRRSELIRAIEEIRGSRVITYVTSSRPNVRSDIDSTDVVHFREHLEDICAKCKSLDIFLYSYGGELEAAWELVSLLREYNIDFSVLVPFHARSAATMIALGGKEIVMGKTGSLGPIDPTIRITGGELDGMEISATDMDSFEKFLHEDYGVQKATDKMKAFELLTQSVSPILIGQAYRNYIETRKDAENLLARYNKNPAQVKKIVQLLIEDISTHNHSVSRQEAKEAGLKVVYAPAPLENAMWNLYKEYEKEMDMDKPYVDLPPKKGSTREVPFTFIESDNLSTSKVGLQKFTDLKFPKGSRLVSIDDEAAIQLPSGDSMKIVPSGTFVAANGLIYDKTEDIYWKTKKIS